MPVAKRETEASARTPTAPGGAAPQTSFATDTIRTVHAKLRQVEQRKTGDDETLNTIMAELIPLLNERNVAEITRSLSPEELRTPFGTAALTRWLTSDPATAAAWIGTHDYAMPEQAWLIGRDLLKSSGSLDAACATLPEGGFKQAILNGAALGAADRDPRAAVALAGRMEPGDARTNAYETIAYSWATSDAAAAQQWALSATDPMLRQKLLAAGAKALAGTDPDLAATWLAAAVKDGATLNDTALMIAETWSDKDPAAAAAWVATFGDGTPREAAIEVVVKRWMKSDAAAANAWLLRQPERAQVLAKLQAEENEAAEPKD